MQHRIHVFLYDFEFSLLCRVAGRESLSRTIARLIKMEAAAARTEPPEGVYRSANGDVYTVAHLKEPAMICFECKEEKPTRACARCHNEVCDDCSPTAHAAQCWSSPDYNQGATSRPLALHDLPVRPS